jgi:thymidylate synthase (FAD)
MQYVFNDDIGGIEVVQQSGTDHMIAAAARVSYGNDIGLEDAAKDERLIRRLMRDGHGSPFEHNLITFRVVAPLFVVQEMLRHRIGVSFNQISMRYVDQTDDAKFLGFYTPQHFRVQSETNKQASDGVLDFDQAMARGMYETTCRISHEIYRELIEKGVPREQARGVLPHCTYTALYITMNARSLMHFLELRLSPNAQWEIRQYADAMLAAFYRWLPMTAKAWEDKRAGAL